MQNNDMARKIKLEIDGGEFVNLVSFGEIPREKTTVEVPAFQKLRTIQTGVDIIPPIDVGFKVTRNSDTNTFLRDWYTNAEAKDVVVIETDGAGVEIDRMSLSQVELGAYSHEEYDASAPAYYRVNVRFLPYDIEFIE